MRLSSDQLENLRKAAQDNNPVDGFTHGFYRYPACFSPVFARAMIRTFTKPGDVVLDPFMGGGTAVVEAFMLGRRAIGADISQLAVFISQAKTTVLSKRDLQVVRDWASRVVESVNLHCPPVRPEPWVQKVYQRNINGRSTWPIRKSLELFLAHLHEFPKSKQRQFTRCVLLRTGKWAFDCRATVPSVSAFRRQFLLNIEEMLDSACELLSRTWSLKKRGFLFPPVILNRSATGIEQEPRIAARPPRLILTSPPYPGVHVLYHRWQVLGRQETPAPFWIAGCMDGSGASFYTFGDRTNLLSYYRQMSQVYASLSAISGRETLLVQLIGFSNPAIQLPRHLEILRARGFREIKIRELSNAADGRLWRQVPNRKWYAEKMGATPSSQEVVLLHRAR